MLAVLTHEVFEHGLLMSQQVVNDGLPSNEGTGQETKLSFTDIISPI